MLQTVRPEKVDRKNAVICLVPMFLSWVVVLKLSKKVYFLQFYADSARNKSPLKTFTYMYLRGLVSHFQKMVLFKMLWHAVLGILMLEVKEFR